MRFMLIMRATEASERGVLPTDEERSAMLDYKDQLTRAGVLLAGDGLHPSSRGARVSFDRGRATVTDGPFTETKELIAGFWIIQVASRAEAIEWVRRCPAEGTVIEVRQIFELDEFDA